MMDISQLCIIVIGISFGLGYISVMWTNMYKDIIVNTSPQKKKKKHSDPYVIRQLEQDTQPTDWELFERQVASQIRAEEGWR